MDVIDNKDVIKGVISNKISQSLSSPEHINPNYLVVQVVNDRPDSIEIKEDAKGNLHATLKVYGDFVGDSDGFIKKTKEIWDKVNHELLRRDIPVSSRL